MTLTESQENEIKKRVIERFGEDIVKTIDMHFMEFVDIRVSCRDSIDYPIIDFLEKVREKYRVERPELLLAALLFGMKIGELDYIYYLKKTEMSKLPKFGHAS